VRLDNLLPHRILDGPMAGREIDLPRGTEVYNVGPVGCPFFQYEFAGKDGVGVLLALRHRNRKLRRQVMAFIGLKGRHPAILALPFKKEPYRTPKESKS